MALGLSLEKGLRLRIKKKKTFREKKGRQVDLNEEPPSLIGIIEDHHKRTRREREHFFRPSMLFGCDRENYFHYTHAPARPPKQSSRMLMVLDNGNVVHELLQGYLADHPHYWFAKEPKVRVVYDGAVLKGSCDGVLIRRGDGYRFGIEIKTLNHEEFMTLTKPKPEHVLQASIYMVLQKLRWITILYWDKDKQHLKEFPVSYDFDTQKEIRNRVRYLKGRVDKKKVPAFDKDACNPWFCHYPEHCVKLGAPVLKEKGFQL